MPCATTDPCGQKVAGLRGKVWGLAAKAEAAIGLGPGVACRHVAHPVVGRSGGSLWCRTSGARRLSSPGILVSLCTLFPITDIDIFNL